MIIEAHQTNMEEKKFKKNVSQPSIELSVERRGIDSKT